MRDRCEAPRRVDQPEPGYFVLRLVRGGPLVPAKISHDDGYWSASILGRVCGHEAADPVYADGVFQIWHGGDRTTQEHYDYLIATVQWAREFDPQHPFNHPSEPIDLHQLRSVF